VKTHHPGPTCAAVLLENTLSQPSLAVLVTASDRKRVLPRHNSRHPGLPSLGGQSRIKGTEGNTSGRGEHHVCRVVSGEVRREGDGPLNKYCAADHQGTQGKKIGDSVGEMPASESFVDEESLPKRVRHFEQAEVGYPEFDIQLFE